MPKVPHGWFGADSKGGGHAGTMRMHGHREKAAHGGPSGHHAVAPRPKYPIGPVKGYPEMGRDAWRTANDDVIVAAVNNHNSEHHYYPGDMEYMTPQLMKAWMMRESGGNPHAFMTDPFQVNNRGDWVPEKSKVADLREGQKMTPRASAHAALRWLHHKGRSDSRGKQTFYQGHYEALRKYNAAAGSVPGIPKGADYANAVLNSAWASYGDWQQ